MCRIGIGKIESMDYVGTVNQWPAYLIGFLLGGVASHLANHIWETWARLKRHRAARQFVGQWEAYELKNRQLSQHPLSGAGLTTVSLKSKWYSANSGMLDVEASDLDAGGTERNHKGHIILDPQVPWLARRVARYEDSHEVTEQKLVLGLDPSTVYVFPVPSTSTLGDGYSPHAWKKRH
jgi:hypothetical protein